MHSVRLCEVMEQKKKAEDDKAMTDEDKRKMDARLDERINDVQRMIHNEFDMVNQLLSVNHAIYWKVEEIANMKSQNDIKKLS